MTEVKRVGRRRGTQLLDNLRNRRRYWEIKEDAENRKYGNDSLSIKHKEEMHILLGPTNKQHIFIIIIIIIIIIYSN